MLERIVKLSLAFVTLNTFGFAAVTAPQTFTIGQTTESFSQAFLLAQFNPALGTLTGIHFRLDGSETSSATVTNTGSASASFTYNSMADIYITDSTQSVIFDETLPGASQSVTIPGGGSRTFTGVMASSTSETEYTGSAPGIFSLTSNTGNGSPDIIINSSAFIGAGTINLVFNGDNVSNCSGPGSICSNTSGTGGGTLSLYYIYSPGTTTTTPEPGGAIYLGFSLVGLGLFRFRRRID